MNNIKIFQSKNDNRYSLVYRTNIHEYIKQWYWYDNISDILCEFDCIMISSIQVPMDKDFVIGQQLLKEFCDIMTAGNKVVIFDMEELLNTHDIDYICFIEDLMCRCNFISLPVNSIEIYDTYVYINTNGAHLLDHVDVALGIYYD